MTTKNKTTWRTVRLGDVASKITKGTTPTTLGRRFVSSGINFIKAESITDDSKFIPSKFEHIDADTNAVLKRSIIQEDDILYSIAGVIGRPALVRSEILPANTNQALAIIRPDVGKIEPRYLFYFLSTKAQKKFANNLVAQSAQPNINLEQVSNLEFQAPALEEQKRIVEILSAFDEKIEDNNRIIKTLEEMAHAIFQELFDISTEALPKGWGMKKLGDLGKIITGKTPSTKDKENFGSGYPFITIPDLQNGVFVIRTERFLSTQGAETMHVSKLPIGAICVSCIATVGLVGIATRESFTNQQINSIIPNSDALRPFLFLLLRGMKNSLQAHASGGTAAPIINKGAFEKIEVVMPPEEMLTDFYESVNPMFEKILAVLEENQKLAAMRDLLLPRLMSGEIQV